MSYLAKVPGGEICLPEQTARVRGDEVDAIIVGPLIDLELFAQSGSS